MTTKICAKKKVPSTSATANNFNIVETLRGPKVDDLMISDTVVCKIIQMISICGGEASEAYLGGNNIVLFAKPKPTYLMNTLLVKKQDPAKAAKMTPIFVTVMNLFFPWVFSKLLFLASNPPLVAPWKNGIVV